MSSDSRLMEVRVDAAIRARICVRGRRSLRTDCGLGAQAARDGCSVCGRRAAPLIS